MASKKEGEGKLKLSHTQNEKVVSRAKFWHNPVYVMQQDRGKVVNKEKTHLLPPGFWENSKGLVR